MQREVSTEVGKMPMARSILEQDPNLRVICKKAANNIPIESIILCGSRATKQGVTENSDYDLPVVMKTYLIPFYLSKLKKIEKELSQNLGENVTLNPLPTSRIKRAKGNLFLFKVKKEGITMYGRDYIKTLEPGEIKDIPVDKYFSFLFSAAKDLTQNFEPQFLNKKLGDEESKKILFDAAKTIIYCAELRLLLNGYYETKTKNLVSRLIKSEPRDFSSNLKTAIKIKIGDVDLASDPLEFWFKARAHISETFRRLMQSFMNTDEEDIESLIREYLDRRNRISIKNFEYFALTSLIKKEVYWRALFTKISIEDRMRIGLLYLLLSVKESGNIEKGNLNKAYEILEGFITFPNTHNGNEVWKNIKIGMNNYWPFVCTVMGV